jgi:hypothetical protein
MCTIHWCSYILFIFEDALNDELGCYEGRWEKKKLKLLVQIFYLVWMLLLLLLLLTGGATSW